MPILKIRNHLKSDSPAVYGTPPSLAEGELAYNERGLSVSDGSLGGSLFIGNGQTILTLVSSKRQVEVTGNQQVYGIKQFRDGIHIGQPGQEIVLPSGKGDPGEVLTMDAAGNAAVWKEPGSIAIKQIVLTEKTGDVVQNANEQRPNGFTVNPGEMAIISDPESGAVFIWGGGPGTFGSRSGHLPVTQTMLTPIGVKTEIATDTDIQTPTGGKVLSTDTVRTQLFRTDAPSGDQHVTVPKTIFEEKAAGDGNGKVVFLSDITAGATGKPISITAFGGSVIKGDSATELLKIENAVLDAGTY